MANVPLKSITFPGLDDTYTVTQIDANLTASGKAADAKVTGDSFNEFVEVAATASSEKVHILVSPDSSTIDLATQDEVDELKNELAYHNGRLEDIDGKVYPTMELGAIAMAEDAIAFQNSTTSIRTPQSGGIRVTAGTTVSITNTTSVQFKVALHKDSDSKYTYTTFDTAPWTAQESGELFIVMKYTDGRTITNIGALENNILIQRPDSDLILINYHITKLESFENNIENNRFNADLFGPGDNDEGIYYPTLRPWRVSSRSPLVLPFSININTVDYAFVLREQINGTWVRRGGSSAWYQNATINANVPFMIGVKKYPTEQASGTADVNAFVDGIFVTTDFQHRTDTNSKLSTATKSKISAHMTHFYNSNVAESYIFFTDPHTMGTNGEFDDFVFSGYMDTLKTVKREITAPYVVCGGDWLTSGDTKAQASVKLGYVDGKMEELFPGDYYPIVGNHDFNYLGVDGNGNRLPQSEWITNNAMRNFWFSKYDHCYYKFKSNTAQNYVLDTRTDSDSGTGSYDKDMLDWLAAQLIADDPVHATIMMHIYYLNVSQGTIPTRVHAIGTIISAYNNHTTATLTASDDEYAKTYDFTGKTGHIDYVIAGHSHVDFSATLGGVPVIGVTNLQDGGVPTFDLIFADYSNSKVYTTRIGTGNDREFSI